MVNKIIHIEHNFVERKAKILLFDTYRIKLSSVYDFLKL